MFAQNFDVSKRLKAGVALATKPSCKHHSPRLKFFVKKNIRSQSNVTCIKRVNRQFII